MIIEFYTCDIEIIIRDDLPEGDFLIVGQGTIEHLEQVASQLKQTTDYQ